MWGTAVKVNSAIKKNLPTIAPREKSKISQIKQINLFNLRNLLIKILELGKPSDTNACAFDFVDDVDGDENGR